MAKVKRRNPATKGVAEKLDFDDLIALAAGRVELPNVPMRLDYQDDVDTLCIRFEGNVSSRAHDEILGRHARLVGIERRAAL